MPHSPRVDAVLNFLYGASVQPPTADWLRMPVGLWLDDLPCSPLVEKAMFEVTGATVTTRNYRGVMVMILCVISNAQPSKAKEAVAAYSDQNLPTVLGTMLKDVERTFLSRRLNPKVQELLLNPSQFFANNRARIGRGTMTTSGPATFEMTWHAANKYLNIEPPAPFKSDFWTTIQSNCYNIGVTMFSAINNLAQIAGADVQGSFGFTTQLSGCSIIYSVNGGTLVAAHVMPDGGVKQNLPAILTPQAAETDGTVLRLRLAHEGGLSNPAGGGTLGVYGRVKDATDTGQSIINNVRMHGYHETQGAAYFVAADVGGAWHLFGFQRLPAGPVTGFQQIYP